MPLGGTGVVMPGSELERKNWVKEGLILASSQSFTGPYTGTSMGSVIYQKNDISKENGHEVVFQFEGNLVASAVMDKETAFGTGEPKRVFSDRIRVRRARTTADEGDKFDTININAVKLSTFDDSRAKLADKWVRIKDQAIFDVLQGSTTERLITNNFTFNDLLAIEHSIKTGTNFVTMADAQKKADKRRPLSPYKLNNGEYVWLFLIDNSAKTKILSDLPTQNILTNADVRGNDNRLIRGVFGKIGSLLLVEAPTFFGETKGTKTAGDFVSDEGYALFDKTDIEISGLRQFYVANNDAKILPKAWTGEHIAVASTDKVFSRGLLLGAGAVQFAMGKAPDFKVQSSPDFGIKTESCMEFWVGCKCTKLYAENGDYYTKLAGNSYGSIAVDIDVTSLVKP